MCRNGAPHWQIWWQPFMETKSDKVDYWLRGALAVAGLGLVSSVLLWQKLDNIQEQLARQSAESLAESKQAHTNAERAQEVSMETAAKLALTDAKLSEVSLQRSQLEGLIQSLSRSRDDNLVVEIESAIRLAQQQAQMTGSVDLLLAALKTADQRITRAAQPRLTPLQRAIVRDMDRIKTKTIADTPSLLIKMDELIRLADELPTANAAPIPLGNGESLQRKPEEELGDWWLRLWESIQNEVRGLVQVSRIDTPEAVLISPEQTFFLRENLKLRLLNARLGLLARQAEWVNGDLDNAATSIERYFAISTRRVQTAKNLLEQIRSQTKNLEVPRVDDTLTALSTAAGGR